MMVRVNEANPSVGIVGSYGLTGDRVVGDGLPYGTEVVPGRELSRLALLRRIQPFLSPTSLLIRSDLVRDRDPFYDEENIHADHMACYEILRGCDYGFVPQVLTYIRRHDDSITSSIASRLDMFQLTTLDLLTRYGPEFLTQDEFERRLREIFTTYYRVMSRRLIENRTKEYWQYQRQGLKKLGYRFSFLKLLLGTLRQCVAHPRWVADIKFRSTKTKEERLNIQVR
jgi:hypothetical protein